MKSIKYLNGVLTVIAICLVLITLAISGLLPKSYASDKPSLNEKKYISVPLNADGSINVKVINSTMDVNIEEVGGVNTLGNVPINIDEIGGHSTHGTVPVEIEK